MALPFKSLAKGAKTAAGETRCVFELDGDQYAKFFVGTAEERKAEFAREYFIGHFLAKGLRGVVQTPAGGKQLSDVDKAAALALAGTGCQPLNKAKGAIPYVVTSKAGDEDLSSWLARQPAAVAPDVVRTFAFQLTWIVAKLHTLGIQHNDITEQNIRVTPVAAGAGKTLVFKLGDSGDTFELLLGPGHLEVTLFDFGAADVRLTRQYPEPADGAHEWRNFSDVCLAQNNVPEVFWSTVPQKQMEADAFMLGYVIMSMACHARWDGWRFRPFYGAHLKGADMENTRDFALLASVFKAKSDANWNKLDGEIRFLTLFNASYEQTRARTQIVYIRLYHLAREFGHTDAAIMALVSNPRMQALYGSSDFAKLPNSLAGLADTLRAAGCFGYLQRIMAFDPSKRRASGVTGEEYCLTSALFDAYFATHYKGITNYAAYDDGVFRQPLPYNAAASTQTIADAEAEFAAEMAAPVPAPAVVPQPQPVVVLPPAPAPLPVPQPQPVVVLPAPVQAAGLTWASAKEYVDFVRRMQSKKSTTLAKTTDDERLKVADPSILQGFQKCLNYAFALATREGAYEMLEILHMAYQKDGVWSVPQVVAVDGHVSITLKPNLYEIPFYGDDFAFRTTAVDAGWCALALYSLQTGNSAQVVTGKDAIEGAKGGDYDVTKIAAATKRYLDGIVMQAAAEPKSEDEGQATDEESPPSSPKVPASGGAPAPAPEETVDSEGDDDSADVKALLKKWLDSRKAQTRIYPFKSAGDKDVLFKVLDAIRTGLKAAVPADVNKGARGKRPKLDGYNMRALGAERSYYQWESPSGDKKSVISEGRHGEFSFLIDFLRSKVTIRVPAKDNAEYTNTSGVAKALALEQYPADFADIVPLIEPALKKLGFTPNIEQVHTDSNAETITVTAQTLRLHALAWANFCTVLELVLTPRWEINLSTLAANQGKEIKISAADEQRFLQAYERIMAFDYLNPKPYASEPQLIEYALPQIRLLLETVEHNPRYTADSDLIYAELVRPLQRAAETHWDSIEKSTKWLEVFESLAMAPDCSYLCHTDPIVARRYLHCLSTIADVTERLDKEQLVHDELLDRCRAEWPKEFHGI